MDSSPPGSSIHGVVSRQEYWSGLPFPSPGDLPNPGIEPRSPALRADALPSEPLEICSPTLLYWNNLKAHQQYSRQICGRCGRQNKAKTQMFTLCEYVILHSQVE